MATSIYYMRVIPLQMFLVQPKCLFVLPDCRLLETEPPVPPPGHIYYLNGENKEAK